MLTNTQAVRAPRSIGILWKWTGVSAILHTVLVGALCGVSYLGFAKREQAAKAKVANEEATAKKAEADETAKAAASTPAPAASSPAKPTVTDKTVTSVPSPDAPPSAEKILGIDKTAKPGDTPKSPFGGSDDDLLKDLK